MIPTSRSLYLVTALLCAFTLLAGAQQKSVPKTAPDFALTTIDSKPLKLSAYRGKVVLLDFWATWCVPCQTEVPRFVSFQNQYGKEGFQVIGISMDDSPAPVRRFYSQYKMNYPVALGTSAVAESYGGVLGLPITFLLDRNGTIVKRYEGKADLDEMEDDVKRLLASH